MIKLNDFRGIYRFFFFVKIAVGWSKNLCNLIIVVGFNFYANLTVKSSLNRWDQSIIVGQVIILNLTIWIYLRYISDIS